MIFSFLSVWIVSHYFIDNCVAQSHGNGISKTTYAASADGSFEALQWMIMVLNATPAIDSSSSNVQPCAEGTSGVDHDWLITMQRGETVLQTTAIGSCTLHYSKELSLQMNDDVSTAAAITPHTIPGHDCIYNKGSAFVSHDHGETITVNAHTIDTCCKSCVADPNCVGSSFFPIPENTKKVPPSLRHNGPGPQPGEGFGIHVTSVQGHSDWPGLSVQYVEQMFTEKLSQNLVKFDWFLDYNVGFYTSNLDTYLDKLDHYGSSWFPVFWEVILGDGTTLKGYSCFVHVAETQLVVELMSFHSDRLANSRLQQIEPRMTLPRVDMMLSEDYHTDVVVTSVSRAVSSLSVMNKVEEFYLKGGSAMLTMELDQHQATTTSVPVTKRCFQWPETKADVCFTTYESAEAVTSGSFTPKLFEDMLHASHEFWLRDYPACANDKWMDNHYAIDFGGHNNNGVKFKHTKLLDYVVREDIIYTCGGGPRGKPTDGAHYIVDPTGWAIQLDVDMSSDTMRAMPLCFDVDGSDGGDSVYHPGPSSWCSLGTCKINHEDPAIVVMGEEEDGGDDGDGKEDEMGSGEHNNEVTDETGDEGGVSHNSPQPQPYISLLYEIPPILLITLGGALLAFCVGFFRGGGTPQALVLGKGEYELVSREAVVVEVDGEGQGLRQDEDDEEDFFEADDS